jgi:hypothetical protein
MSRRPTVNPAVGTLPHEPHYTPAECAKEWGYSPATWRRLIADEQGVLRLQGLGPTAGKRPYTTYSIPESAALRIIQRLGDKRLKTITPSRNPRRVILLRDRDRGVP